MSLQPYGGRGRQSYEQQSYGGMQRQISPFGFGADDDDFAMMRGGGLFGGGMLGGGLLGGGLGGRGGGISQMFAQMEVSPPTSHSMVVLSDGSYRHTNVVADMNQMGGEGFQGGGSSMMSFVLLSSSMGDGEPHVVQYSSRSVMGPGGVRQTEIVIATLAPVWACPGSPDRRPGRQITTSRTARRRGADQSFLGMEEHEADERRQFRA